MTILGNLFLGLAALLFLAFLRIVYGPAPPQGGDAAGQYPFTVVVLALLLFGSLSVAAFAIGWKGGFGWISDHKGVRFIWVAAVLISFVLAAVFTAFFKFEPGSVPFPFSLKVYNAVIPALLPLLLIAVGAILLNEGWRAAVPLMGLKYAYLGGLALAALALLGTAGAWISESSRNAVQAAEQSQQDAERRQQERLNHIQSCDPASFEVVTILVYTSEYLDAIVREKALEKIKSNPQWEQHLVDLIDQHAVIEVSYFLADNEVEDKAFFAEPALRVLLGTAEYIRNTIQRASHSSYFYENQFVAEVDRAIRIADRFGDQQSYREGIEAIRAALDEPSEYKTIRFRAERKLDQWLKANPE
jgi:hypothetical protein